MASFGQILFGLREVKIYNTDGSGGRALPVAMMFHFTERYQTEEYYVEDVLVGVRTFPVGLDWEIEAGILDLAVYAKLTGRSAIAAGTTPTRTVTLNGNVNSDFPYLRIYGRSADDATGDVHCKIYKAKLTALEGTMRNGQFWVSSAAGVAVADSVLGIFEFVQNESSTGLVA